MVLSAAMPLDGPATGFPERQHSRAELRARAKELVWYHTLRLDEHLTTPGMFALDEYIRHYLVPDHLTGLDCLDVGTGNGYWAFLMERRGARSVTATDIGDYSETDISRSIDAPPPTPAATGAFGEPFRVASALLDSHATYRIRSIYALDTHDLGTFDVVFCASVLLHLFGPLIALKRLARVCRNVLLVSTETDLTLGPDVVRFKGHEIPYVHFLPSPECLAHLVATCGFEKVLRGPTFAVTYQVPGQKAAEVLHTSVLALRSASEPAFPIPSASLCGAADRRASIEFVDVPLRVTAGDSFHIVVRVNNTSRVDWRCDGDDLRICLDVESRQERPAGATAWSTQRGSTAIADYLPAGTGTLVRVRIKAPPSDGILIIRPVVRQRGNRFDADSPEARIQLTWDRTHPSDRTPWTSAVRRRASSIVRSFNR